MKLTRFISISSLAGLLFAFAGCGGPTTSVVDINRTQLAPTQLNQHTQLVAAGDALWAKRIVTGNAAAAINKWEQALTLKASDWKTCVKLSRAYHFHAGGWLSLLNYREGMKLHQRGIDFAEQGLKALSPEYESLRKRGAKVEDAIEVTERDGIPLVYWYGANLAAYAYASGMSDGLKHKGRIEKLLTYVYKTERSYHRYGADRFMAAFFAAAPPFIGGDLEQATEHYSAIAKDAPNVLSAHLIKARFYSLRKNDKAMFEALLNGIINAKPCGDPNPTRPCIEKGFEAEAEQEKTKARALLPRKAGLFD